MVIPKPISLFYNRTVAGKVSDNDRQNEFCFKLIHLFILEIHTSGIDTLEVDTLIRQGNNRQKKTFISLE